MGLHLRIGLSRISAFCILSICSCVRVRHEEGEGGLSKLQLPIWTLVFARKTCPFVSSWTPAVQLYISTLFLNSTWRLVMISSLFFFGNLDESAALSLHIASGDVQKAFHHMGIPEWIRTYFCLRLLSARAFGMSGKVVQGSCVSAERKLFLSLLTLPLRFSRSMFFSQHVWLCRRSVRISL